MKDERRNEITYLLVELCCFPVQRLEERWHDNDV